MTTATLTIATIFAGVILAEIAFSVRQYVRGHWLPGGGKKTPRDRDERFLGAVILKTNDRAFSDLARVYLGLLTQIRYPFAELHFDDEWVTCALRAPRWLYPRAYVRETLPRMPLALRYDDIERADAGFGVRMMPAIRFSMRSLEHDAHGLVFLTGNDDLRAMTTRLIAAGVPVDPPSTGDGLLPRSR